MSMGTKVASALKFAPISNVFVVGVARMSCAPLNFGTMSRSVK